MGGGGLRGGAIQFRRKVATPPKLVYGLNGANEVSGVADGPRGDERSGSTKRGLRGVAGQMDLRDLQRAPLISFSFSFPEKKASAPVLRGSPPNAATFSHYSV